MAKYYFRSDNNENCYLKKDILEQMKEEGLTELKIFEAKIETGCGYYYCTFFNEAGEVGDCVCGRLCKEYKPRNGKNGRCIFSGYCYEQTDKSIILKIN